MAKQVIFVRKDLDPTPGQIAAQVAYASLKVLLERNVSEDRFELKIPLDPYMVGWSESGLDRDVVYVDSEDELLSFYSKGKERKLPGVLVTSRVDPESKEATNLCAAIGPAADGKIEDLIGELEKV